MNSPSNPSTGSDAMKLLELLADPKRAAEVIAAHDAAKASAEEAKVKLQEQAASMEAGMSQMLEHAKDLEACEAELASERAAHARKRDGDLRELDGQRVALTAQSQEMAQRKVVFEQEWATADANQRSRTTALDERERLLVLREETVKAEAAVVATSREAYERDRAALDARQSNLRKLLEQS